MVIRSVLEGIRAAHLEEFFGPSQALSVKLIGGANWFCWFRHDAKVD